MADGCPSMSSSWIGWCRPQPCAMRSPELSVPIWGCMLCFKNCGLFSAKGGTAQCPSAPRSNGWRVMGDWGQVTALMCANCAPTWAPPLQDGWIRPTAGRRRRRVGRKRGWNEGRWGWGLPWGLLLAQCCCARASTGL